MQRRLGSSVAAPVWTGGQLDDLVVAVERSSNRVERWYADAISGDLWRALRLGVLIGIWVGGPIFLVKQFAVYRGVGHIGGDAHAYWLTAHGQLYTTAPDTLDAYLYSPVFAQIIRPLAELPFGSFYAIVVAADVACFVWLLAPLGWPWAVPLVMMMAPEFVEGNVIGVLTAAAVLSLTGRPGWWAVGWLTKVTPGLMGLTWFVSRREWRAAGLTVAWPAGITLVSYAVWPTAWHDWIDFLQHAAGGGLSPFRLAIALVLVAVGARRSWWWAIPVALAVSAPVLWLISIFYLCALPRLRLARPEQRGKLVPVVTASSAT